MLSIEMMKLLACESAGEHSLNSRLREAKKAIALYEELSQSLRNKTSEIIEIKNQIEILSNKLNELKVEKEHIIEDINNTLNEKEERRLTECFR